MRVGSQAALPIDIDLLRVTTEDTMETCLWLKVHFLSQLVLKGVVAAGWARQREIVDIEDPVKVCFPVRAGLGVCRTGI